MNTRPSRILPVIVVAQFFCTSLWFAGNAVLPDLTLALALPANALGHLTSAVQFGFISGTLVYAFLALADRFPPSRVFFFSALAACITNLAITFPGQQMSSLLLFRFLTGFFLAGIYPVGMKLAADHFEKGLGKALGFLVGALVAGTAFPHVLKSFSLNFPWQIVLYITSALALTGGFLVLLLVPDGPFRKPVQKLTSNHLFDGFRNQAFRSAAFGYFGHMWELYTFWGFIPVMLATYLQLHPESELNVPLLSFLIIGLGSLSCIGSGFISEVLGSSRTAFGFLSASFLCCLLSPFIFQLPAGAFIGFLIFWGLAVVADSPMFSTLVAVHAPPEAKGTALTLVTCFGFSITIVSLQFTSLLSQHLNPTYIYLFLAIGPALGLFSMRKLVQKRY